MDKFGAINDALLRKLSRTLDADVVEDGLLADLKAVDTLLGGKPEFDADESTTATLLLDAQGRLKEQNGRAHKLFGFAPGDIVAPDIGLGGAETNDRSLPRLLELDDRNGNGIGLAGVWVFELGRYYFTEAGHRLGLNLRRALANTYGLSPVELDVAAALLRGASAETIASVSGRQVSTVRQQIKSLLAKLGVNAQARAVGKLAGLAATFGQKQSLADGRARHMVVDHSVAGPFGQSGFKRFGVEGGVPVLMFHGALFGIGLRDDVISLAHSFGFDVVAPERPGYGVTPFPADGDAIGTAIEQARLALDAAGHRRVVVLASDVGTAFAAHFAARHPQRVAGLVCAPVTPPMKGWAQTADMPAMHRVSAYAAQKLPALMDRIVWLGLRQIAAHGTQIIPRLVFADSAFDRERMEQPEHSYALERLHAFITAQNSDGFVSDMHVTNRDWSKVLGAITQPFVLLHGGKSRTVSLGAVREMASTLATARLEIVPDAGHTLPMTHLDLIYRTVFRTAIETGL